MTRNIIISNQEIQKDIEFNILFDLPIGALDYRHPSINQDLKKQILYDRYHQQLIADGLETGHFFYDYHGAIRFKTKLPIHSFAGFIFEAFTVNRFNENMKTIGKQAFSWCTNREKCKDDYINQFKVIGTGFKSTQSLYPNFYEPQNNFDLLFIRKNPRDDIYEPALILGTNRQAGIQIKAITGYEVDEIINPIISRKYSHVLTFLRHADGVHSYNRCMDQVRSMYRHGQISFSDKEHVEDRVAHPEMFGIDQREVDDYYEYIRYWFNGHATPDQFISEGIGLEVKEYKYSNGILVPDD